MARILSYDQTKRGYANLWARAQVAPDKQAAARTWAQRIGDATHRPHFEEVQRRTGVPWFVTGLILMRESSLDLQTFLGNGQPLAERTTQVPAGYGPFAGPTAFEDGAVAALQHEGMVGLSATLWRQPGFCLYWMEKDNGEGYFSRGINSPYIWSWTSLYARGKFVGDGAFDPNEVDPQPGCAAILKTLIAINPDVAAALDLGAAAVAPQSKPETKPVSTTPTTVNVPVNIADPIPQILMVLGIVKPFIGFAAALPPPFGPAIAVGEPIIEQLLQFIESAKTSGFDLDAFGALLHDVGSHFQTAGATLRQSPLAQPQPENPLP